MKKSNELSAKLPQAEQVKLKLNYEASRMKMIMPTSSTKGKMSYISEVGLLGPGS